MTDRIGSIPRGLRGVPHTGGTGTFAAGAAILIPKDAALCITFLAGASASVQGRYRQSGTLGTARSSSGGMVVFSGTLFEAVVPSAADSNIAWDVIPDTGTNPFSSAVPVGDLDQYKLDGVGFSFASLAAGNSLVYNGTNWVNSSFTDPSSFHPANPTGITGTTLEMLGLGSTISFTPKMTGKIMVFFYGSAASSTAGDNVAFIPKYGTGSAPANGAAQTGTTFPNWTSGTQPYISCPKASGSETYAFSFAWLITGLTVNTAYWFDLAVASDTASVTAYVTYPFCVIQEVP